MKEVTAREIDKLVCDWSSDMMVPLEEIALNELVDRIHLLIHGTKPDLKELN